MAQEKEGVAVRATHSVEVIRDIVYALYGGRKVSLDLYLPKKTTSQKKPGIVAIHGGAWEMHDKNWFAPHASCLAKQGFVTACIGYRLLPDVAILDCIHDAKAAVRWLRSSAGKYGVDPDRIGAFGGSAGAHLAGLLGVGNKETRHEGNGGNSGVSSKVQAVVAMAMPCDFTESYRERPIFGRNKDEARLLSPLCHVDSDSSPFLLLHSETDPTVPFAASYKMHKKLTSRAVHSELVNMGNVPHAFWNFDTWFDDVMSRSVAFFVRHVKEK